MKLGADVRDGVSWGLGRCGRTARTGIKPIIRHILSKRTS